MTDDIDRSYEISPRPSWLGGGWRLQLLENGVEVGGGVFPPVVDFLDEKMASDAAYEDALTEANAWISS